MWTQNFTPVDWRTRLVYIMILPEGSGGELMENWELVKILTVGWEITCLSFLLLAEISL